MLSVLVKVYQEHWRRFGRGENRIEQDRKPEDMEDSEEVSEAWITTINYAA